MADEIVLVRHGETEWTRSGRHTSFTDLDLTADGRIEAARLSPILANWTFSHVLSSPLARARQTAELALNGLPEVEINGDLVEWNYGDYEGQTKRHIHESAPKWSLWADGAPGGESPADITARVDRLIAYFDQLDGVVCAFAHGHVSRVLGARWIGLGVEVGRALLLGTGTVSVLGYDHGAKAIRHWNVPSAWKPV